MRHLGIDFGTKNVGLALSDDGGNMGFPYGTLLNDRNLVDNVASLIEKEHVEVVVLGESLNFSGEQNLVMRAALQFAEALEEKTKLAVILEPEMLTTQEAMRDPEGVRMKGGAVDAQAAALILTSYLSRTK